MGKVTIIIESDTTPTTCLAAAVNDLLFTEDELAEAIDNYYGSGTGRIYVVPGDE